MIEDVNQFLAILQFLRKRLHFYDGLIVLIILFEALYCIIAKLVGSHVMLLLNSLGWPAVVELCHVAFLMGFFVAPIAAIYLWCRVRSVPKCRENEIGIVFAPNPSPETQSQIERLFVHLKQEIKSHEFGIRFSIKRLPLNHSVDSAKEATSVLRASGAVVAIWGPVEQQPTEQGKVTGFSKISFTFVHRPAVIHPSRQEALVIALVGRHFHLRERTQIADQRLMAKDIGIIVRNILGVALLIDQRYEDASKILGPLYIDLQAEFPEKRPLPVKRFCLQVQIDFAYALTRATTEEYRDWLSKGMLYEIPTSTLEAWLSNVNHAARLDPQNSMHYLTKAIYQFLLGDVKEAIKSEKKQQSYLPEPHQLPTLVWLSCITSWEIFNGLKNNIG
jgi:hypothetical protein